MSIVRFIVLASPAHSVDVVVAKVAHASLLRVRVDLVLFADNQNAVIGVGEGGVSGAAPALVILRVVGLVIRAPLADVLDYHKAWLALANTIDQYLVGSTCIVTHAPLGDWVVAVSFRALSTDSAHAIEVGDAVAEECVKIEYLVFIASIAVVIGAGGDLGGGFAVGAIVSIGGDEKCQN